MGLHYLVVCKNDKENVVAYTLSRRPTSDHCSATSTMVPD